jgi:hypothetical protein
MTANLPPTPEPGLPREAPAPVTPAPAVPETPDPGPPAKPASPARSAPLVSDPEMAGLLSQVAAEMGGISETDALRRSLRRMLAFHADRNILKRIKNNLRRNAEVAGPLIVLAFVVAGILFALIHQPNSIASDKPPPAIPAQPKYCSSAMVKTPAKVSSPSGAAATLSISVSRGDSMVKRESGPLAIQKARLCPGSILTVHVTQFAGSGGQVLPVNQVASWAQVENSGTNLTVWVVVAPRYLAVSGAGTYYGTITLDSPAAEGANIPVSINIAYQNLYLVFALGFLAAFGGFTWAWLLHNATHEVTHSTRVTGSIWRHSLLCVAVLLATAIPIVDTQVLNKPDWQGTLIQYIGMATLIGTAAVAATPTLRALALPPTLQERGRRWVRQQTLARPRRRRSSTSATTGTAGPPRGH